MPMDARDYPDFANLTARSLKAGFLRALERAERDVARIAASRKPATFENTILKWDHIIQDIQYFDNIAAICEDMGGKVYLNAAMFIHESFVSFFARSLQDPALFARITSVAEATGDLDPQQRILTQKIYRECILNGANLAPAQQRRFNDIQKQLKRFSSLFGENLKKSDEGRSLVVSRRWNTDGMPDKTLKEAARAAKARGLENAYYFKTKAVWDVLFFAHSRYLRKRAYRVLNKDTAWQSENWKIAAAVFSLRSEMATLLGYRNFSHMTLSSSRNLMQDPADIEALLQAIHKHVRPKARQELNMLKKLVREDGVTGLEPWDILFYQSIYYGRSLPDDAWNIRDYLPLNKVLDGLFAHWRKLGFQFIRRPDLPGMVSDNETYEVRDVSSGITKGLVIFDLFARPDKKGGPAVYEVQPYYRDKYGREHLPIYVWSNDLTRGRGNKPCLIDLEDLTIILHENGHIFEGLTSQSPYYNLSPSIDALDIIEVPSTWMENFASHPSFMRDVMFHHETDQPVNPAAVRKWNDLSTTFSAVSILKQLAETNIDLMCHQIGGKVNVAQLKALERAAVKPYQLWRNYGQRRAEIPESWHLFSIGLEARYYGYMLSEILSLALFAPFKKAGPYNARLADRFNRRVIGQNCRHDPDQMMTLYTRGKGVDPGPYFKKHGLIMV